MVGWAVRPVHGIRRASSACRSGPRWTQSAGLARVDGKLEKLRQKLDEEGRISLQRTSGCSPVAKRAPMAQPEWWRGWHS